MATATTGIRMSKKVGNPSGVGKVQKPAARKVKYERPRQMPLVEEGRKKSPNARKKSPTSGKKRRRKERRILERVEEKIVAASAVYIEDHEKNEARIKEIISELPKRNYSRNLTRLLFNLWSADYDRHMRESRHDLALGLLLSQAVDLNKVNLGNTNRRIFGTDILEMAGGTGTVIELLCSKMPDRAAQLKFTLNDISPAMVKIAKKKLKPAPCSVNYTGDDIRELSFGKKSKDMAILSQTLHLIADPQALEQERHPDYLMADYMAHTHTKINVIRQAFEVLRKNGYFILIDEFPAFLSGRPKTASEVVTSALFRRTFRPVDGPLMLRATIMENIPSARFESETKIPIDSKHSMYAFIYSKDPDKMKGTENVAKRGDISKDARMEAHEKVVEGFRATDAHFLTRYHLNNLSTENGNDPIIGSHIQNKANGNDPIIEFLPMSEGPIYDSRNEKGPPDKEDHYNGVIVAGDLHVALHNRPDLERTAMMQGLLESVKTGGWLMVMGEWPVTGTNNMSKMHFRETFMKNFKVMFEGALRARVDRRFSNTVYGYLYRKRG